MTAVKHLEKSIIFWHLTDFLPHNGWNIFTRYVKMTSETSVWLGPSACCMTKVTTSRLILVMGHFRDISFLSFLTANLIVRWLKKQICQMISSRIEKWAQEWWLSMEILNNLCSKTNKSCIRSFLGPTWSIIRNCEHIEFITLAH